MARRHSDIACEGKNQTMGITNAKGGRSRALVTGGGSGIGLAIARRLEADGMAVLITGRTLSRLAATGLPHAVMDVTDAGSVNAVMQEHGPFTVVVSSAGVAPTAPALKTPASLWHDTLATNLTGTYNLAMATLPAMVEAGTGRFVAVASTAALRGYRYTMAYSASKHGVLGLVRTLALELAKTGVTCNAVCPGFTDTEIVRGAVQDIMAKTGRSEEQAMAAFTGDNPMARLVTPKEVADTVVWLCGAAAASVNGAAIPVDGGELAG